MRGLGPFFARARDPELAPLGLKQRGPPRAARKYGLRPDLVPVCPVQSNGPAFKIGGDGGQSEKLSLLG